MRVIAVSTLRTFWEQHPDAEQPLKAWYKNRGQTLLSGKRAGNRKKGVRVHFLGAIKRAISLGWQISCGRPGKGFSDPCFCYSRSLRKVEAQSR